MHHRAKPADKAEPAPRAKMAKRKAVQDAEVAGKTIEKGLLIVHTGTGKGKSTAAFGLALRCSGAAIASASCSSSRAPGIRGAQRARRVRRPGRSGTRSARVHLGDAGSRARYRRRRARLGQGARADGRPVLRLVVLDELNIALRYDYLRLDEVVAALAARRPDLHVVVTGRNAKPELIAAADLVTEMALVKHHFAAGVKAQPGIEF